MLDVDSISRRSISRRSRRGGESATLVHLEGTNHGHVAAVLAGEGDEVDLEGGGDGDVGRGRLQPINRPVLRFSALARALSIRPPRALTKLRLDAIGATDLFLREPYWLSRARAGGL